MSAREPIGSIALPRDAIYRVPCATPMGRQPRLRNWVTITRDHCHMPLAALADGAVELLQRAAGEVPAVLQGRWSPPVAGPSRTRALG